MGVPGHVLQARFSIEDLKHLFGVGLPVGRKPQAAAGFQARRQHRDERRLDKPAFVVALLMPGIRKKNQHLIDRGERDLFFEHFNRVVADDAQIRQR